MGNIPSWSGGGSSMNATAFIKISRMSMYPYEEAKWTGVLPSDDCIEKHIQSKSRDKFCTDQNYLNKNYCYCYCGIIQFRIISWIMQHFDWFFTDDLLEDRLVDEVTYHIFLLPFISNNSLYVAMPLFIKWIIKHVKMWK